MAVSATEKRPRLPGEQFLGQYDNGGGRKNEEPAREEMDTEKWKSVSPKKPDEWKVTQDEVIGEASLFDL